MARSTRPKYRPLEVSYRPKNIHYNLSRGKNNAQNPKFRLLLQFLFKNFYRPKVQNIAQKSYFGDEIAHLATLEVQNSFRHFLPLPGFSLGPPFISTQTLCGKLLWFGVHRETHKSGTCA